MSVDVLPLLVWSDDDNAYIELGVHLLPEYYAREAARFAAYRWGEWLVEDAQIRIGILAHWFAHRLFSAHENDAVTLREESDARSAQAGARRG